MAILGLSSDVVFPPDHGCLSSQLAPLTFESKLYLSKFVDGLKKQSTPSNHSLGFEHAFQMLWATLAPDGKNVEDGKPILFVYLFFSPDLFQ